jgi:hypothetical protein
MLVELLGNVNASIGDSIVQGRFAGKTLESAFSRISGTYTMHRDAGLIVEPDYVFTCEIMARLGEKTPGRRSLFMRLDVCQAALADSRYRKVASGGPQ